MLWISLRFLTSGPTLPGGGTVSGVMSVLHGWEPPLADPGVPGADRVGVSFCPGSISFCQLRKSFLARFAKSSSFVFFLKSLMCFPRRVSYRMEKYIYISQNYTLCVQCIDNSLYNGIGGKWEFIPQVLLW